MDTDFTCIFDPWSMKLKFPLRSVFPGLYPATNPRFALDSPVGIHPPPVTKSFARGASEPHVMSLCACETITWSPVNRKRLRAFTVMSYVPPWEASTCSLMIRVKTPGTVRTWFGRVETTIGSPPTRTFASSLSPATPVHVADERARTKSAVTPFAFPGSRLTSATAASLCAVPSNPIVTLSSTSAVASDVSTDTKVASIVPPSGGSSPVSENRRSPRDVWTKTPVARPLYVVSPVAPARGAINSPARKSVVPIAVRAHRILRASRIVLPAVRTDPAVSGFPNNPGTKSPRGYLHRADGFRPAHADRHLRGPRAPSVDGLGP